MGRHLTKASLLKINKTFSLTNAKKNWLGLKKKKEYVGGLAILLP
jgi:hypothetical protein